MPKGDIELPNLSGKVDPTIEARASAQRTKDFYRRQPTTPRATAKKRSLASRMFEGYRALSR